MYFFFFKQKTAYEMRISDLSSDVCSSDLSTGRASPTAARSIRIRSARRAARRRDERGTPPLPAGPVTLPHRGPLPLPQGERGALLSLSPRGRGLRSLGEFAERA